MATKDEKGAAQPQSAQKTPGQELALMKKNITDSVMERVNILLEGKELKLPENYIPGNALQSAWFVLQDAKTKDSKPVLEACDRNSIANSLYRMVVKGLSVAKKQGYFIAYGNQLQFQESYFGNLLIAKRDAGVKEVNANCVFEGDTFKYEVDTTTGRNKLIEHSASLDTRDIAKIKGAYAIVLYNDGTTNLEVMTMAEIKKSWEQGATKGNSPAHRNFTDQMCNRTVINRACKIATNSSDDSSFNDEDDLNDPATTARDSQIKNTEKRKLSPEDDIASHTTNEPEKKNISAQDVAYEDVHQEQGEPDAAPVEQGAFTGPGF